MDTLSLSGLTELMKASFNGNESAVTQLLDNLSDDNTKAECVNSCDADGRTALHLSAMKGHLNITQLLVKAGADVATNDSYGQTPLIMACDNGNKEAVQLLLDCFTDDMKMVHINIHDYEGHSAIFRAADKGHNDIVRMLMSSGGQQSDVTHVIIGSKYVDKLSVQRVIGCLQVTEVRNYVTIIIDDDVFANGKAIFYVALKGSEVSSRLLKSSRTVPKHGEGWNLLMFASYFGLTSVVNVLLDYFPDKSSDAKLAYINALNDKSICALYLSAQQGHREIVNALLKSGGDVTLAGARGEKSLLMCASYFGRTAVVKVLLDYFADEESDAKLAYIKSKDIKSRSALFMSSLQGHCDIVDILIASGADVPSQDDKGLTPLMAASIEGHLKVVEALLCFFVDENERVAHLNQQGNDGCTAISLAAESGYSEIVECLIKFGSDIRLKDNQDNTPLTLAADNGNLAVVEILLDSIMDEDEKVKLINTPGSVNLYTPISLAALRGHYEIVKLLIQLGGDVTIAAEHNWTPFMAACHGGHKSVAELLLSCFPDQKSKMEHVNAMYTLKNRSAIYYATWIGRYDIVLMLLQMGANILFYDSYRWSPLMRASNDGNLPIVKLLLDTLSKSDSEVRKKHLLISTKYVGSHTAAEMAKFQNHREIHSMLKESFSLLSRAQSEKVNTSWR